MSFSVIHLSDIHLKCNNNLIMVANKKNNKEKNNDFNYIREHLTRILKKIELIKLPEEIIIKEKYNIQKMNE